ncbi:hypothetical protein A6R68_05303, partial [Neotoma lepida]
CDDFKHQKEVNSVNSKQNGCCGETKVVLDCTQRTGKHVEGHWFCCGIKCYYFIKDNKHWSGCKQTCHDRSLSLLKIEDDDELASLIFYGAHNNLMTVKSLKESEGCAFLKFGGIQPDDCGRNHPCVCEKKMDKFPDSVNSMKE